MRTLQTELTPEQAANAERIYQTLRRATEDEHWRLAQLLASKSDSELLGATEFEVRDIVHEVGAKAIETALDGRKKGATKDRA